MENVTKTRTSLLGYIKNAMKVVFESKEDIIANNIDEIADWSECLEKKDTSKFSDDDRKEIENIMKLERSLKMRQNKVKGIKENLKAQVNSRETRPSIKAIVVEREERQK